MTINIVKLIEKNPITNLSNEYQNKLLTKIKSQFTNKEQQLFVASFYCFLIYDKNDFVVDFNDIWKWVGFTRKGNGKKLLEKNFVENIDYKILLLQSEKQDLDDLKNKHGGNNKEQILLTINTFKKFCLKADTKQADEIHNYYIKLEELLQETINEESTELRNQLLLKNNQIEKNDIENKLKIKMSRHNTLMELMKTKKCVYIVEIEENNLIKIGSSKDIEERRRGLVRTFGTCIFLEIFECDNFREAEESIFANTNIINHLYKKKINGHLTHEVVQLTKDFTYLKLYNIVKLNVSQTYLFTPVQLLEKQKMDLEKQKMDYDMLMFAINNNMYDDSIKQLIYNKIQNIDTDTDLIEKKSIKNVDQSIILQYANNIPLEKQPSKRAKNGQYVQKIDPDDLTKIINVYDSMIYVLRDPENLGFQKTSIQNAIKNNTVYKGFRWNFVKKEQNPNVVNILPTVEAKTRSSNVSTILQLNYAKTEICDSFITRQKAAKALGISCTKLNSIIANGDKYCNYYYIELNKCSKELLDKYEKPIKKFTYSNAKLIKQTNPLTKQIFIFNSMSDIYRKYSITSRTIVNAINSKTICNGFLWEYYNENKNINAKNKT